MSSSAPDWARTGKNIPRLYALKRMLPAVNAPGYMLWGATAATGALFLVQPFGWIDKTFIHPPPPEEEAGDDIPEAAK